ncbi:DNA-binding protein [Klebsiella pneumoniae]|uniref:DNA-binding protein n=1 Tax=Klebsiella pneumoniae TaxID=573 RepID=A0A2X3DAC7_KLEPN|nr:DNA-binding protein [Klebsiella pneumoniae]
MTAKNKYKSPAFEAIHSAASGLFSVGAIPQETMRHFDESCLGSVAALQPIEIKALREQLNVSQPRVRSLSEYQRVYRAKMGDWR